ncbi:MAG: hypothetical protein DWQ19_12290 [Crenarchaeota archaeon]|nr:MAG: hypothetical protein DWQ19_12290 [Thermoproteota archaeon]
MTNKWLDTTLKITISIEPYGVLPDLVFQVKKPSDFESCPKRGVYRYFEDESCYFEIGKEDHIKIQEAFAQGLKELNLNKSVPQQFPRDLEHENNLLD